jgi:hypothetical protein
VDDKLKATKLTFLAAYQMFIDQAKGFNLGFYRWDYGPLADGLYQIWDELSASEMVPMHNYCLEPPTDRAKELAEDFRAEVLGQPENIYFRSVIDRVATEWGPVPRPQLMDMVYAMSVVPVHGKNATTIREMPRGTQITMALDADEADETLLIDPDWLATLELEFDCWSRARVEGGVEDMREGRVRWDPVL